MWKFIIVYTPALCTVLNLYREKCTKNQTIYPDFMPNNRVTVPVPTSMHTDPLSKVPGDLSSSHLRALHILADIDISGRDGRGGIGNYCIWEVIPPPIGRGVRAQ